MSAPARLRRRLQFTAGAWPLAIAVCLLIVVPLVYTVVKLFLPDWSFNSDAFVRVWNQPGLAEMFRNTVILIVFGTLIAVVLATLFAWLNERTDARMGWLAKALPTMPLFVPPMAAAVGWALLATPGPGLLNTALRAGMRTVGLHPGDQGPLNIFSWWGLIAMYGVTLLPYVYLPVSAALRNMNPALEEASRSSGAGPMRTLWKVTVPAVKPSLINGLLLALTAGFALFSIPVVLGTPAHIDVLTVRIVRITSQQYPADLAGGLVLGLVIVAVIGTTWYFQQRLVRKARHSTIEGKFSSASRVRLGVLRWPMRLLMLLYGLVMVILPIAALVIVSFQSFWSGTITAANSTLNNWRELFAAGSSTRSALINSLILGVATATIAIAITSVIAYLLDRRQRNPFSRVVDGTLKLPATLSHVVIAVALIAALAGPPLRLHGSILLLLLGYLVIYFPQASITSNNALSQVGGSLSEASLMSGAPLGRTFRRIVAPLMMPGLLTGWILVFVLASGDLTASAMLASPNSEVVGFVMLDLNTDGTFGQLAAMGATVSVISSVVASLVLLLGRERRRGGRRSRLRSGSGDVALR